MNKKNIIPFIVIGMCGVYLISVAASVAGLLITGSSVSGAVIALELSTALSAPAVLLLFGVIPSGPSKDQESAKRLSVLFMACCMILTSAVHFVQLTVTQPLIASGISVPYYLQVGHWPSVSMAVEYLAWGFFTGSAFICSSYAVGRAHKYLKWLKNTLLSSGLLCYAGFLSVVFINENGWYIAPLGYGIGTAVVCIIVIRVNKLKI